MENWKNSMTDQEAAARLSAIPWANSKDGLVGGRWPTDNQALSEIVHAPKSGHKCAGCEKTARQGSDYCGSFCQTNHLFHQTNFAKNEAEAPSSSAVIRHKREAAPARTRDGQLLTQENYVRQYPSWETERFTMRRATVKK